MGLSANHSASTAVHIAAIDRAGLIAAVSATVIGFALTQLRLDGLIGLSTATVLAGILALLHFVVVFVVAARTRSLVWGAYLVMTVIGFVSIGAVTPVNAVFPLFRLSLG